VLKVGLTGSIATGKSFVISVLRELGCHVLDADVTAREVVAKGTDGLAEIAAEFGPDVLAADGSLDRKKLAAIVFDSDERRLKLNSIVHPRVFASQEAWLKKVADTDPNGIAVVDAALMIESGGYKRFTQLIVVICEPAIQLARLLDRDNISVEDAQKRIASQMPQQEKIRYADHVIDSSLGFDDTRRQTEAVFLNLKKIAENNDEL